MGISFGSSGRGTGMGMDDSIPKLREQEGNGKRLFPKFGNGKGIQKSCPNFGKGQGMKKEIPGIGRGMKKSDPTFGERESGAIIPRNSREREWKEKSKLYDSIKEIFRKYLT